jgi:triacylglycerol esterase/lipase EstA (alpha/beta hydrolase family)
VATWIYPYRSILLFCRACYRDLLMKENQFNSGINRVIGQYTTPRMLSFCLVLFGTGCGDGNPSTSQLNTDLGGGDMGDISLFPDVNLDAVQIAETGDGSQAGELGQDSDSVGEGCLEMSRSERGMDWGERFVPHGVVDGVVAPCQTALFLGVAAGDMQLLARLTKTGGETPLSLRYFDAVALGEDWEVSTDSADTDETNEAALVLNISQTGRFGLAVEAVELDEAAAYEIEVLCIANCEQAMTRYPIVLLHGMAGSDDYLDLFSYYFGVEEAMEAEGYDVHVPVVDPFETSEVRALQWITQLDEILLETGSRKLNLMGHSQGGIDGRAIISSAGYGTQIASLTTIAAPHYGTPLADLMHGLIDVTLVGEFLVDAIGDVYGVLLGEGEQDVVSATESMTQAYIIETFNPQNPDDDQVAYFSWAGRTCGFLEFICQSEWDGEIVSPFLVNTYHALQLLGYPDNDGLVTLESAQWGEFLGELPADHLDEVGLLLGSDGEQGLEHIQFFLSEGARLFSEGL